MDDHDKTSFHMTPDEFRRHGHAVVDWIADYMELVESVTVHSPVQHRDVRAMLPDSPTHSREPFYAHLADDDRLLHPPHVAQHLPRRVFDAATRSYPIS